MGLCEAVSLCPHKIETHKNRRAHQLSYSTDNPTPSQLRLRSGLYVLRPPQRTSNEEIFVIYWPEDTTWEDSASLNVCRNRATFIQYVGRIQVRLLSLSMHTRYLSKICDQIVVMISPEHAQSIVWNIGEGLSVDNDDDESTRLVTFEVAKTNEQEEAIITRPGFQVRPCMLPDGHLPPP